MSINDIISLIVTALGVISFSIVFTILFGSYTKASIIEIESGKRDIELLDENIYENTSSVKKRKKIAGIIKTVIFYAVIALLIPTLGSALYSKITSNVPMINGKAIMVVATGSMSFKNEANDYLTLNGLDNQFPAYSIIVIEKVEQEELEQYDVISFVNENGVNIIHRIYEIKEVNGKTKYITRGDANNKTDDYDVYYENIVGRYSNKYIPGVGLFILFFQSFPGIVTILAVVYVLLMIDYYSKKTQDAADSRVLKLNSAIGYSGDTSGGIKTEFIETIYYQGYAYYFNQDGFVKKEELDKEAPYYQNLDDMMVKVVSNKNEEISSEVIVLNESEGEA